ncbi:hypothetical protein, partial [Pectinatus frisingensis]|uniref:hypothetical protein n=1 Tax=Pectinatus frisingensis TaxID=865 RepID=UPI0018C75127
MLSRYKRINILTALIVFGTYPGQAAPTIPGEDADIKNIGSLPSYTINGVKTTYLGSAQDSTLYGYVYYNNITLANNSVWRPLDYNAEIDVDNATIGSGTTIDLAYKYSSANGYTEANYGPTWTTNSDTDRNIVFGENSGSVNIGNNITFRINLGTANSVLRSDGTYAPVVGYNDGVFLINPILSDTNPDATVNIKVQYILNKNFAAMNNANWSWANAVAVLYRGKVPSVFYIGNSSAETLKKINVTGESINQVDGALNKYIISSELLEDKDYTDTTDKGYSVYWSAQKQNFLSQGAYSAANA